MDSTPIPSRIGVREIAKQMGVSHETVSMALRNDPRVAAETREEVQRYAEKAGYHPDPMLEALAYHRRRKAGRSVKARIAWINAEGDADRLRGCPEFAGYWKGANAAAEKWGFRIEEFRMGREVAPERLHRVLKARRIRGILLPPHAHQPSWGDFPWDDYAVVRLGRSLRVPMVDLVAPDEMSNAILAYTSMRERGYRRIAFVSGRVEPPDGQVLGAGWLATQQMAPEEDRVPAFTWMTYPVQERVERFRRWLDDFQPDAILSDAPGIGELLKEADVEVPRDLGLAMTDRRHDGAGSGVDHNAEELGRSAFLMLNSQITEGRKGEPKILRQLLIQGDWVDGTSLPWRNTGEVRADQAGDDAVQEFDPGS